MSKAIVNALAMALAMEEVMSLPEAIEWATTWVEQNLELFGPPVIVDFQGRALGPQPIATVPQSVGTPTFGNETWQVRAGDDTVAPKHVAHVVGPDGLTDKQRAGAATVGLCPNCQQPANDHLPGCFRDPRNGFSETDASFKRAVTKAPLPPAE